MKMGRHNYWLLGILIIFLILGAGSLIYAEEESDQEIVSTEQTQDQSSSPFQDDNQSFDQTDDSQRTEKCSIIPEFSATLEVVEITPGKSYDVILSGIPEGVFDQVVVKVWSEQNGEDDIIIYAVEKQNDSSSLAHIATKKHKHLGQFNVVAYGVERTEASQNNTTEEISNEMLADQSLSTELARTIFETPVPQGGIVSASSNCTKGTITAKLEGVENNNVVKEVRFHIWSKSNRSDFKSYSVKTNTEGVYSVIINLKDFLNSPGTYQIRAYSVDTVNNLRFHGKAAVNMQASTSSLNVTIPSGNTHFRTVTASGIEAPCGVKAVKFAVWSDAEGQDDLRWYTAKSSDSAYTYTFDVRNHKSSGLYNAHVYVVSKNGVSRCTKTTTFTVSNNDLLPNPVQGIDVSKHNGTIDWAKVKNAGIKYAIIRCGYGDNLSTQDDTQWTRNVAQCEKLGIPYGVYIYSYATDVSQAKSEAEHCIRLLKGHNPQYPVFLDLEDDCMSGLSNAQLLQITVTWAEKIKMAGYTPGVYSSKYWWTNRLTSSNYNNYKRWVAQWNSQCTYNGTYCMWQYSSTGKVNGISGNVDMDYAY